MNICSNDYSLHHNLHFGKCKFEVRSTSLAPTGSLLHSRPGPSSLTGRGRASQLSWPGWLRVREASCSTGAVPSHFHFIYLPPPSSLHPSIHLSLLPFASSLCQWTSTLSMLSSTVPSQLWQSKWHLFVSSLSSSKTQSLSAVICLFLSDIYIYIVITELKPSDIKDAQSNPFMFFS